MKKIIRFLCNHWVWQPWLLIQRQIGAFLICVLMEYMHLQLRPYLKVSLDKAILFVLWETKLFIKDFLKIQEWLPFIYQFHECTSFKRSYDILHSILYMHIRSHRQCTMVSSVLHLYIFLTTNMKKNKCDVFIPLKLQKKASNRTFKIKPMINFSTKKMLKIGFFLQIKGYKF